MLSFEDVMKVRRLEQNAARLVKLEAGFYDELSELIDAEKRKQSEKFSLDQAREFENLKHAVLEIYNLREKKILNQALRFSRTGSADKEHMQDVEQELFDSLVEFLKRSRSEVMLLFEDQRSETKKPEGLNKVSLVILKDVPSFMGTDMKEYGPFKEGDELELKQEIADLLVNQSVAKEKQ